MTTYLAVVPEKRLLFAILPFIIIIGTIPIQRLIQYGLSTFSFTNNMKNIALIIIILLILGLSLFAAHRYSLVDSIENEERIQFGNYLTVTRGFAGSVAAAHVEDSIIYKLTTKWEILSISINPQQANMYALSLREV